MIDRATIDRIYQTANIVEVISDFISLQKKGTNYQACCPFHGEKTPSFVVSPSRGIYKCFGCGKGGNAISFVMEHEGYTFVEALKYVANKYGIEVEEKELTEEQKVAITERESMMQVTAYADNFFKDKLLNSSEGRNVALSYLREREITDLSIEKFQLGYCPSDGDILSRSAIEQGYKEQHLIDTGLTIKRERGGYYDRFAGRVIFPIQSISGRVIGFGGRTLATDKKIAKYLNSPESEIYHKSGSLYGIFQAKNAISKHNKCILVEGYTDVISMHQAGIENVVASSGTSLTEDQIKLIRRFTNNITIIYDGDSAGVKASMRGINMVLREGLNVRIVALPEGEDPDTFAKSRPSNETADYIFDHEEDFISFKAKLLLHEVKNDPIAKAGAIKDMVESIAVVEDEILRGEYIKECSRIMDIDDQTLLRETTRYRVSAKGGREAMEFYRNTRREQLNIAPPQSTSTAPTRRNNAKALFEMEKELITYLLKQGGDNFRFVMPSREVVELNIAEVIIEEMEIDDLAFVSPLFDTIFNEYKRLKNEGAEISLNDFINYPDPNVCDFVVNIISQEDIYRHSKIWERHSKVAASGINLSDAIPKCIALYKLKRLECLISERKESLKSVGADYMGIIKEISALNESRKEVCNKYERIL